PQEALILSELAGAVRTRRVSGSRSPARGSATSCSWTSRAPGNRPIPGPARPTATSRSTPASPDNNPAYVLDTKAAAAPPLPITRWVDSRDGASHVRNRGGAAGERMMPRYQPADSSLSPRFVGVPTFARLPLVDTLEDVDVAVVGVPFDTGVTFRVGGRFGPNAVRAASLLLRPY